MTAPVAWLLDTNVVSEMMRPRPEPRVAAFLDRIADEGMGLSPVTVWEILNGVGLLDEGRRRDDILRRFEGLLDEVFEGRILDWTLADARNCAVIMEEKRRRGESLDHHLPDAFLLAAAVSRGLSIVTRNEKQFRHAGTKVVNPWAKPDFRGKSALA